MSRFDLDAVVISRMSREEVDIAVEWAKGEGWNPGVNDAECFYQADPQGFYCAKLEGEIVGSISLVRYPGDFVFEGLYIVKPQYRYLGVGTKLQRFALELCSGKNLGLDGVISMQQKYTLYGLRAAYSSVRYMGSAKRTPCAMCEAIKDADFREVAAYDQVCFGFNREGFLRCWLNQSGASARLIRGQNGALRGYGVVRRCVVGYKVGPLFADSAQAAEMLYESLTGTVGGEGVFLDVPSPNGAGVALALKMGMQPVFSTVRMYSEAAPDVPLEKVFGVTSFELG